MHAAAVTPSSFYTSQCSSPSKHSADSGAGMGAGTGAGAGAERGWSPTPFAGTKAIGSSQKAMMENARQHFRDKEAARQHQTGYR